jgi:hypothetical protein
MLLPSLLKQVVPKMKVGFFLHTPFPSSGERMEWRCSGVAVVWPLPLQLLLLVVVVGRRRR